MRRTMHTMGAPSVRRSSSSGISASAASCTATLHRGIAGQLPLVGDYLAFATSTWMRVALRGGGGPSAIGCNRVMRCVVLGESAAHSPHQITVGPPRVIARTPGSRWTTYTATTSSALADVALGDTACPTARALCTARPSGASRSDSGPPEGTTGAETHVVLFAIAPELDSVAW